MHGSESALRGAPALEGQHWGATLLSLSGELSIFKRKYSLLPVLVVLFCVSYGILTMLVVEQGRTIDNQKSLIRQLFNDTAQLNAMRMQQGVQAGKVQHPAPKVASPARPQPKGDIVVSPRDMQTQAPLNGEKNPAKPNQGAGKLRRRAPLHPPRGMAETGDERRAVLSI
jgi:hypothetical protein